MAIIRKSEVVEASNIEFPKDRYRARIIETKYGKSAAGNKMTTLYCEVITEFAEVGDKKIMMAGKQFQMFLMHMPDKANGEGVVFEFCRRIEAPIEDADTDDPGYDPDKHQEYFRGREFDIVLSAEELKATRKLSNEEWDAYQEANEDWKKEDRYVPIQDGEGNPITSGFRVKTPNPLDVPEYCSPEYNEEFASRPV